MSKSSEYAPSGAPILRYKDMEREWQSTSYVESDLKNIM